MKNGFLRLSTIMLALISCSAAYANNDTSVISMQKNVTSLIPPQKPGFAISITGLYLEPSASNLGYAIYTNPLPLPAPNWEQKVVNPAYSGAFDLGLRYSFINGRDNVRFNWLYFNSKDSDSAYSTPNTSVGPPYYYGPTEQFLLDTHAHSHVKFNLYDGRLIFGHLINLSNSIQVEPFVGLSAAYLRENITNNYRGTDPLLGPYQHDVYIKSTFTGVGPSLGLDSSYFITDRFALKAKISGNLFAGVINYTTNFTSSTAYSGDSIHNSTPTDTSMSDQNINRIVPEVDTKLAVLYKVPFNKSGSELTLEAGFMWAVYFNAINQVLPVNLVPTAWEQGTVAIINQVEQQSNLDLRGPFISLAWNF